MSESVAVKVALCKRSFFHFLAYYVRHRLQLPPPAFHADMVDALDSIDDVNKYIAIMGFRGSAKSTILEAFALWSMINGKHNFIIYMGATIDDAKLSLANIRDEIEQNADLRRDFQIGLKMDKKDGIGEKWSEAQLTIGECTIMARSRGQKIRGMKYKNARIDLIIADDLEDARDADTAEKRLKTRQWFFTEVLPATKQGVQSDNVKVVMLGNLVHRDCLIMHLMKSGTVRALKFPLIDDEGQITWPGLYPDMEAVEKEKAKVLLAGEGLGHVIWAREYLLKEVDSEDMIIKLSDIQFYDDTWLQRRTEASGVGVDLAISKTQKADYTAMAKGIDVKNDQGERRLLVLPNAINKRMNFTETVQEAVNVDELMPKGTKFYVEKVNYQEAASEIMEKNGIQVERMAATGDKRSRAISACFYIKTGRVLFPKTGAENIIEQLLGFGIEDHDDLVDALVYLILGMVKRTGGLIIG